METTRTIAKINNVSIQLIENGGRYVPIRPICEALGVSAQGQLEKIKTDEILAPTLKLSVMVGADKKDREMACIPFMYVFGWLFTINPKNVNPAARKTVTKYRLECYNALFRHFTEQSEFLEQKQEAIKRQADIVDKIRADFRNTQSSLKEATTVFKEIRSLTFEEWQENKRQLHIDFPAGDSTN